MIIAFSDYALLCHGGGLLYLVHADKEDTMEKVLAWCHTAQSLDVAAYDALQAVCHAALDGATHTQAFLYNSAIITR